MPVYCYETSSGGVVDRVFPIGKAPKYVLVGGRKATRSFSSESCGVPAKKGWPMTCCASGVNAEDAAKLRKHLSDRGVPTDVTSDGDPVYRDPIHR